MSQALSQLETSLLDQVTKEKNKADALGRQVNQYQHITGGIAMGKMAPAVPLLQREFGLSLVQSGWLIATRGARSSGCAASSTSARPCARTRPTTA